MSKWTAILFLSVVFAAFTAMNRGAYKGYFSDDEVDNLSWTPHVPAKEFARAAATPRFLEYNFRPVGHLYFKAMERLFGLDFPKWVGAIHLLHFLNIWLVWALARKLGAGPPAAAAGVLFFAFHMALFDALWKPMYVFDVACATFCLTSLICFIDRRWVLSFVSFWLAYKSKELAVMLPLVMLAYEWWMGEKRWKPLLPFFAVSLSFGLQGVLLNPNRDNDYTFRFTPAALAKTSVFYAGKLLLVPLAGFALPAVPLLARNRRAWFGLAMAGLFCLPLLFLPGRLFSAYCYVPFAGVALVASGFDLKSREARAAAALLFVLWAPWDYSQMRVQRRGKLARDDEVRAWMGALGEFGARGETIDAFVFAGAPAGFQRWGIEGAIKHFFPRPDLEIRWNEDPEAQAALHRSRVAMLTWDYRRKLLRIVARTPETAPFTYLKMDAETPVWQLGDGWFGLEDSYRWTKPQAMAELWRPAGARRFELRINIGPEEKQMAGRQQVTVTLGEASLDPRRIAGLAWQTLRWDLPPAPESRVQVKIEVSPGFRPRAEGRELGLAVGGFGFVAEGVE